MISRKGLHITLSFDGARSSVANNHAANDNIFAVVPREILVARKADIGRHSYDAIGDITKKVGLCGFVGRMGYAAPTTFPAVNSNG
jgi:hypothetical protein